MLTTGKGFGELNETLFDQINALARATAWLHGVIIAYAGYGVVVFALLLGAGWWLARRSGEPRRVAAVVCAGAGTLLAVGINSRSSTPCMRPARTPIIRVCWCWHPAAPTSRSPPIMR